MAVQPFFCGLWVPGLFQNSTLQSCVVFFSVLLLVEEFTCLGSNISSNESDVNICKMNAWNVVDRLSIK